MDVKQPDNKESEKRAIFNLAAEWGREVGIEPTRIAQMKGAGSSRRYYRILMSGPGEERTIIATAGMSDKEYKMFIELSELFAERELNAPRILASDSSSLLYLQQDLGDESLFDIITRLSSSDPKVKRISEKILRALPKYQLLPDNIELPQFGKREILADLYYFMDCLLRPLGLATDIPGLTKDFEDIASRVEMMPKQYEGMMLRDFQSRNVMVLNEDPYLIDYQGAYRGSVLYDAISFLWQAKANFSPSFRRTGLQRYAISYSESKGGIDIKDFLGYAPLFALFRTIQVLGAYGLRGVIENKPHFLRSIPSGVDNLLGILENPYSHGCPESEKEYWGEWPALREVARQLYEHSLVKRIRGEEDFFLESQCKPEGQGNHGLLNVTVCSFSYKKGYPSDISGNGGGFAFDCRGLHNPGRYDEYKEKTGRDRPVAAFLEAREEVSDFLTDCKRLVGRSIDRYIERGFNSLQVSFGCTGGQHRSVYCAEQMALWIEKNYTGVRLIVNHREQGIRYVKECSEKKSFKAMILAAGLGTRLKPWTLEHPKALVPVGGIPMFFRIAKRLFESNCRRIGVNVCHFAEQMHNYFETEEFQELLDKFNATACVSDETGKLLDTGGGIVRMSSYLDPEGEGFLVHNVDILSNADLDSLIELHRKLNPKGITLLTSGRESTRKLVFNKGELIGWKNLLKNEEKRVEKIGSLSLSLEDSIQEGLRLSEGEESFSGIYVIGTGVIEDMRKIYGDEAFPIMDYLLNKGRAFPVVGICQKKLDLIDVGKPESLLKANEKFFTEQV